MAQYEYKVIPAPARGLKAAGVKRPDARFALALEDRMNTLAAEGWEYQRADVLPSEERQGLTSTQTVYRSVLVFRRPLPQTAPARSEPGPLEAARRLSSRRSDWQSGLDDAAEPAGPELSDTDRN